MSPLIWRGVTSVQTSDPSICRVHQALWRRRVDATWMQRGCRSLRVKVPLHLHVVFSGLPKCFQPELPLARVDCRRRSDAGALALGSGCDGLHGVEVLRAGAPFLDPSAGALAQGSDNTFTPTVRAFGEGFHFVIITQQLQREEDGCIFQHVFSMHQFLRTKILKCPHTKKTTHGAKRSDGRGPLPWRGCSRGRLPPPGASGLAPRRPQVASRAPRRASWAPRSHKGRAPSTWRPPCTTYTCCEAHRATTSVCWQAQPVTDQFSCQ